MTCRNITRVKDFADSLPENSAGISHRIFSISISEDIAKVYAAGIVSSDPFA